MNRDTALNTLAKCIANGARGIDDGDAAGGGEESGNDYANTAASAFQCYCTTVIDCLKNPDISICQCALKLIYHLANKSAELLNYLVLRPRENCSDVCKRILRVVDNYSPDDR